MKFSKENSKLQIKLMKIQLKMQQDYIKTIKQNPLVLINIQKKKEERMQQENIQNYMLNEQFYSSNVFNFQGFVKTKNKKVNKEKIKVKKEKILVNKENIQVKRKEEFIKVNDEFNQNHLSPLDQIFVKQLEMMNDINKRKDRMPQIRKYIPPINAYLKVYYAEHINPYLDCEEYEHNLSQVYDYKEHMHQKLHKTMHSIDEKTSQVILDQETMKKLCPMGLIRKVKSGMMNSLNIFKEVRVKEGFNE